MVQLQWTGLLEDNRSSTNCWLISSIDVSISVIFVFIKSISSFCSAIFRDQVEFNSSKDCFSLTSASFDPCSSSIFLLNSFSCSKGLCQFLTFSACFVCEDELLTYCKQDTQNNVFVLSLNRCFCIWQESPLIV